MTGSIKSFKITNVYIILISWMTRTESSHKTVKKSHYMFKQHLDLLSYISVKPLQRVLKKNHDTFSQIWPLESSLHVLSALPKATGWRGLWMCHKLADEINICLQCIPLNPTLSASLHNTALSLHFSTSYGPTAHYITLWVSVLYGSTHTHIHTP